MNQSKIDLTDLEIALIKRCIEYVHGVYVEEAVAKMFNADKAMLASIRIHGDLFASLEVKFDEDIGDFETMLSQEIKDRIESGVDHEPIVPEENPDVSTDFDTIKAEYKATEKKPVELPEPVKASDNPWKTLYDAYSQPATKKTEIDYEDLANSFGVLITNKEDK